MKRKILIFLLALFCLLFAGCKNQNASTLADLAQSKDNIVYLLENGSYTPFLALDSKEGNVLLLRKEVMENFLRISDYSAEYENSDMDSYLSTEYLGVLTDNVNDFIVEAEIEVASKTSLYKAGTETHTIIRKVFLLSYYEMNYSDHSMAPKEGSKISFFTDDQSRVAYRNGEPCSWWLRTPYTGYDSVSWSVGGDGTLMRKNMKPKFPECTLRLWCFASD